MARGDPGEEGYRPQVMPEDLPRKIVPRLQDSPVGGALEHLGNTIDAKYQADSATWAGNQLAAFRIKAVQDLEGLKQNTTGDPNGFTPKYLAQFDKQAAPLLDTAGSNPFARQMLQKGIGELRDTLGVHAVGWEAQQNTAYRVDSVRQSLTSQLPSVEAHPELAPQVGSTLMDQINSMPAEPSAKLTLAREMHEQLSLAAANGLARQNPTGVLKGLDDPTQAPDALKGLTDPQREAVRARASAQFVDQRARGIQDIYQNAGTTAGAKALTAIDKDASIPAELRDPIRDKVNGQVNQLRTQRREQYSTQVAQIEQNIGAETAGPADRASAMSLYEKGAFNPTELGSVMEGIARSEREGQKKGEDLESARQAYGLGVPMDPEDSHAKKGVGLLFNALTQDSPPGSPDYVNRAVDVTAKVGVAPEPAISWVRSQLIGGDPKAAAQAADMVSRLESANPRAVPFAMDPKSKAIANTVNEAVAAGTDPTMAVTMARKNAEESDNKTLDEKWAQVVGTNVKGLESQGNALQSRLASDERFKPGMFTSLPQVPLAMQSEFDVLTRDYFRFTGGDVKQARDLATRDLTHVWGVSEVNGKRQIMAYAPEAMFPGLTPANVREDIASTVKDMKGVDAKGVQLVMDPQITARTQGSQWNLASPDKNGLMDVMRDTRGNPLVYQLPVSKEDYAAIRERERAKTLAAAVVAHKAQEDADAIHEKEALYEGSP